MGYLGGSQAFDVLRDKLADEGIRLPADLFEPEPFARRGGSDNFSLAR